MSITTMTHPEHVKLDICPPWCAGHTARYQPWDDFEDRQERAHASESVVFKPATALPHEDIAVELVRREDALAGLQPAQVSLYATSCMDLTPAEARQIAAALLAAADRAEAGR